MTTMEPDPSPAGALISHDQAADYLGVPPRTLHDWNYKGTGPRSYRIGRARKYRYSDLDDWIAQQAVEGGTGGWPPA